MAIFSCSLSHNIPVSHHPLINWHVIVISPTSTDMLKCGEHCYYVLKYACSLFTGSCWRSDVDGQTSPPPRGCKHRLMKTHRGEKLSITQQIWKVLTWTASMSSSHRTCMAPKHVNSSSIVLAPTAHHVVLEIRLSHV